MKQEKKRETKAKEHNLRIREISDSLKRNNIRIIQVPEEEEKMRQKVYVSKLYQKTFLIWGRTQRSKCKKHRELP